MYEVRQSLNLLNEKLIELSKKQDVDNAKHSSDKKAILIDFENLKDFVDKFFKNLVDRIGVAESQLFRMQDKFKELAQNVTSHCVNKKEYEEELSNLESLVVANQLTQKLKNDNFNQYIQNLQAQSVEDIKKLKEELTPKEPKIDPVKAQIDERFKVWKVDFDGLVREIALLKRDVGYDQKKFENIYTLIERLKSR